MGFINVPYFLGQKHLSCWANLQFWVSFFRGSQILCYSFSVQPMSTTYNALFFKKAYPQIPWVPWPSCSWTFSLYSLYNQLGDLFGLFPMSSLQRKIAVESHGSKNTSFPENFLKSMGLPHLPQASYIDFRHQETTGRVASLAILCWEYLWIGNRLPLWSDPLRLH